MTSFLLPLEMPSIGAALRDAKSNLAESRWVAAMALGRADEEIEKSLEALAGLTGDPVDEVRAQALEGLLELRLRGAEVSDKHVVEGLKDPAACVRCAAVDAAAVFIEEPEDVIAGLLSDDDPSVRATSLYALGELGSVNRANDVAALLDDKNEYVVTAAALALGELGDSRAEQTLVSCLKRDSKTALDAAFSLGKLRLETSVPALKKLKGKTFAPVELKAMAAAALVRCSDVSGIQTLEQMLEGRRQSTRMIALTVLARLPIQGIENAVLKIAGSEDGMESSAAKETLRVIRNELGTGNAET